MVATGKEGAGGFRIADLQRPAVGPRRRAGPEKAATSTTGFPAIEQLLDSGDIEAVIATIRPRYAQLEAMAAGGPIRERGLAKRAMAAYERAADLLEHLFDTKEALSKGKGER